MGPDGRANLEALVKTDSFPGKTFLKDLAVLRAVAVDRIGRKAFVHRMLRHPFENRMDRLVLAQGLADDADLALRRHGDHRLDPGRLPDDRSRLSDPPAPAQILQGIDHGHHMDAGFEALQAPGYLCRGQAVTGQLQRVIGHHLDVIGSRPGIYDKNMLLVVRHLGRQAGALAGAAQMRGQQDADQVVAVCLYLLKNIKKNLRRRLGRQRKLPCFLQKLIKSVPVQIHSVQIFLSTQFNLDGHKQQSFFLNLLLTVIGGRIYQYPNHPVTSSAISEINVKSFTISSARFRPTFSRSVSTQKSTFSCCRS